MTTTERNYAFRQRLDDVHKPGRRDPACTPADREAVIADGWRIVVPENASRYLCDVAADLQDYLFTSMAVSTLPDRAKSLDDADAYAIVLGTRNEMKDRGAPLRATCALR